MLTEPASSQTERRSRGGWPRPNGCGGPCPAVCNLAASACCCSMYCRMLTSWTTALMPSPTAWLWRLQLATRMTPVCADRKEGGEISFYFVFITSHKWLLLITLMLAAQPCSTTKRSTPSTASRVMVYFSSSDVRQWPGRQLIWITKKIQHQKMIFIELRLESYSLSPQLLAVNNEGLSA